MKKIIISSIVIGLILILGITTIVLSVIPTGLNYTIEKPNEVIILSAKTDFSASSITGNGFLTLRDREDNDSDKISNIYSIFCHAFEQKTLNAIFNGQLNETIKENHLEKGTSYVKSNADSEDKMTIIFKFKTKQNLKQFNYDYNYLLFEISNTNERVDVTLAVKNTTSLSTTDSSYSYNYYYSGKANFYNLYNYIQQL